MHPGSKFYFYGNTEYFDTPHHAERTASARSCRSAADHLGEDDCRDTDAHAAAQSKEHRRDTPSNCNDRIIEYDAPDESMMLHHHIEEEPEKI